MPVLDTTLDQQQLTPDTGIRLELTRVIKAPRARVFDAWTRPETIRQWFGPGDFTVPSATTDPKPGGAYEIHMQGPAPCASDPVRHAVVTGSYTRVEPYDLLQFTWSANWAPDERSLVTIHLRDMDGGTELRLVHERFAAQASSEGHARGWNGSLDNLVKLLAE